MSFLTDLPLTISPQFVGLCFRSPVLQAEKQHFSIKTTRPLPTWDQSDLNATNFSENLLLLVIIMFMSHHLIPIPSRILYPTVPFFLLKIYFRNILFLFFSFCIHILTHCQLVLIQINTIISPINTAILHID